MDPYTGVQVKFGIFSKPLSDLSFSCNSLELLCTELSVKKAKIAKTLQVISMAEPLRIQPLLSAISYAITSLCIFSSNQHTFF